MRSRSLITELQRRTLAKSEEFESVCCRIYFLSTSHLLGIRLFRQTSHSDVNEGPLVSDPLGFLTPEHLGRHTIEFSRCYFFLLPIG